jgi:hypothetical protein
MIWSGCDAIERRIKIRLLERRDGTIDSAFAPAWNTRERILRGGDEGASGGRLQRPGEAGDQRISIIGGEGHCGKLHLVRKWDAS